MWLSNCFLVYILRGSAENTREEYLIFGLALAGFFERSSDEGFLEVKN